MSGGPGVRTVAAMSISFRKHALRIAFSAAAALLCTAALWPTAGQAAGKIQTLRFFSKEVSITLTTSSGKVLHGQPLPDPRPGDVLDVFSLDFRGNHRHHAARFTASDHLRCVFAAAGEPDCTSHVAIGGSLLIIDGNPGTVVGGTGRFRAPPAAWSRRRRSAAARTSSPRSASEPARRQWARRGLRPGTRSADRSCARSP
jgi:hypothetical protein